MKKIRLSFQGSLLAGGVLFGLIVLLGLLAPWVAPHDPLQVDLLNRLAPPSRKYPFGTDHLGPGCAITANLRDSDERANRMCDYCSYVVLQSAYRVAYWLCARTRGPAGYARNRRGTGFS